jgi:hypothetical protein
MQMRNRLWHSAGLAVYLAAVVVCPGLHLVHHADGTAHAHDGGGAAGAAPGGAGSAGAAGWSNGAGGEHSVAADLVALGLEDVGAASPIDCTLAPLTLADCDAPAHGVRRFGDPAAAAAAGHPPSHPSNLDPRHGAGTLAHLGVSLLAARAFVLPPPRCPETRVAVVLAPVPVSVAFRRTWPSRGPPAAV